MSEHDNISVNDTDLAHFDDVYKDSEVDEDGFDTVPDGKYQVNVDRVELVRTTKGDPMLKWTMRILGPNFAGRNLWRYNVMASDENIRWLKKDLYACELRLTRISELPANLERLLDVRLEVTKRTKGEYESIYINKRIRTADDQDRSSGKTSEALSKF
jgi:hypothetical protein